ncbi:MAG: septation regulator SpoVG [Deltaproteobacteria bacterium]|nr:septation regulator SpoVG [Deltaproteobacteria bacterium]
MNITEVRVFPVNEDKLKAYATITFDDCFVVRDLKVINGNSGLFVAMPSKKRRDGSFKDVAHPLNNEFRAVIENAVLDAYEAEIGGGLPAETESSEGASSESVAPSEGEAEESVSNE